MNREDRLLAYSGIDIDRLSGSQRNKEIAKLLIAGMTYKKIGEKYGISTARVAAITSKLARIAMREKVEYISLEWELHESAKCELDNISIGSDTDSGG